MKKLTARNLVQDLLGHTHLSQKRIDEAVQMQQDEGWVLSFHPTTDEPDRAVVAAKERDGMYPLLRLTYAASCESYGRTAVAPRRMVEKLAGFKVNDSLCGCSLSQRGLLLAAVEEQTVNLIGTNPSLARLVNEARYAIPIRGRLSRAVVQAALGMNERPKVISKQQRQAAIAVFRQLKVTADDLKACEPWIRLESKWQIK